MVYRFKLISEEVNGFYRIIDIDPDATFIELRDCVCDATGFSHNDKACFFFCDEDWVREKEISISDNGSYSDQDVYLMDDTRISEIIEDEGDHLSYLFDQENDREFFMELKEIIFGQSADSPVCVKKAGNSPVEKIIIEEPVQDAKANAKQVVSDELDLDFYGEDGYNEDEIESGYNSDDMGEEESGIDI